MQINEIEAALSRLMPPPLSVGGQRDLEALIDELAGIDESETAIVQKSFPWKTLSSIAAGILAIAGGFGITRQSQPTTVAGNLPGVVLLSESDRVQSIRDEGWSEDAYGSAMHSVRLNMVEENRLMDEETGIVVRVSEPREEIFFTPITAF